MAEREKTIYRVTLAGSAVNLLILVFKFVAGIVGHSSAMIADAVHSLSDFVTDIIVIAFVRISSMPEDEDHDYGHGKYETLASQIIGIVLGGVGVMLGWNAVRDIYRALSGAVLSHPGGIALVAAFVSIVLKEIIYRVTMRSARKVASPVLEANAWHHRSDALSSVGTAVGIGGAMFLGDRWAVLDPVAALVVSIFIMVTALGIIREASEELLEKSLPADIEKKIEEIVYRDSDAFDVHHVRTRKIGSRIAVELHVRFPGSMPLKDAHDRSVRIEHDLKEEFGQSTHIMLHLEPEKDHR